MAGFDWVIAAVILVSIIISVFRGFIKEALSLISWLLAIWLGITFCVDVGDLIHQYIEIPTPKFREWAGFAAIFIGTLFLFSLLSYLVSKFLVKGPVKGVDRALGVGFGFLRGVAVVVALLMVVRALGMENSQWWQNSKHITHFEPIMNVVEKMLPNSLQRDSEQADGLEKKVQQKIIENIIDSVPTSNDVEVVPVDDSQDDEN